MSGCCVPGCKNRHSSTNKLKLYRIPTGSRPFQANRRRLWLQAIEQASGGTETVRGHARVCGAHFISGEASMDHDDPDFVPSVFTCTKQNQVHKGKMMWFPGHRERWRRTANAGPRVDSPVDLQSSDFAEEIQSPSSPSVPTDDETLTEEAEGENKIQSGPTSRTNEASPLFEAPAGFPELDKRIPIVALKSIFAPGSGYRCEVCSQIFTIASQLVKHKQIHEEEKSFICKTCGKIFTNEADFTEHQCVPEPSFPCNMCERSFTSGHNLKRHKLLHVKDGRKCSTCGALFCRRHSHVVFQPQIALDRESSVSEPEDSPQELFEPSEASDHDNDDHSATTTTHLTTATAQTATPTPPNLNPLSDINKALPPLLNSIILSKMPLPVLPKFASNSRPPLPLRRKLKKRNTSSQLNCPTIFSQPCLQPHPQLPSSLKIFSPQCLTSALFHVKRDYGYILSKSRNVISKEPVVKEEQCELPLDPPDEQSVDVKKEKTAYDMQIVL